MLSVSLPVMMCFIGLQRVSRVTRSVWNERSKGGLNYNFLSNILIFEFFFNIFYQYLLLLNVQTKYTSSCNVFHKQCKTNESHPHFRVIQVCSVQKENQVPWGQRSEVTYLEPTNSCENFLEFVSLQFDCISKCHFLFIIKGRIGVSWHHGTCRSAGMEHF